MSDKPKDGTARPSRLSPTIVAAVIAALATVIAAYFQYLGILEQTQRPIEATLTAEARPTVIGDLFLTTPESDLSSYPSTSFDEFLPGQELLLAAARNRLFAYNGLRWSQIFTVSEERIGAILSYHCDVFIATERYIGRIYHYMARNKKWRVYDTTQPSVDMLIRYRDRIYASTSPYGIILEFDGLQWSAVYEVDDTYPTTMAVYKDHLYVGTEWRGIVYRYDGVAWLKLKDTEEDSGGVFPLIVYQGKLFCTLGNSYVLYSYDGSQWLEVYRFPPEEVLWKGSAIFKDQLYIAPLNSGNVYRYNNKVMELVTTLPVSRITAMIEYSGKLFVSAGKEGVWIFDGERWLRESSAPRDVFVFSKYVTCPQE